MFVKSHMAGHSKVPGKKGSSSPTNGTSLAVWQWMELVRGERLVMRPHHPYRVETVQAEEHYCLYCFGVRWWDMVRDAQGGLLLRRCRCCGQGGGG